MKHNDENFKNGIIKEYFGQVVGGTLAATIFAAT